MRRRARRRRSSVDPSAALCVEQMEVLDVGRQLERLTLVGRTLLARLAHDHHLAVVEPADQMALVAERLDHGDLRRDEPLGAHIEMLGPATADDALSTL